MRCFQTEGLRMTRRQLIAQTVSPIIAADAVMTRAPALAGVTRRITVGPGVIMTAILRPAVPAQVAGILAQVAAEQNFADTAHMAAGPVWQMDVPTAGLGIIRISCIPYRVVPVMSLRHQNQAPIRRMKDVALAGVLVTSSPASRSKRMSLRATP